MYLSNSEACFWAVLLVIAGGFGAIVLLALLGVI